MTDALNATQLTTQLEVTKTELLNEVRVCVCACVLQEALHTMTRRTFWPFQQYMYIPGPRVCEYLMGGRQRTHPSSELCAETSASVVST